MSRVKGALNLRKKLRTMPDLVTDGIKREIELGANEIGQEIEARAPRNSGDLAENVTVRISNDKLGAAIGYSPNRAGFKRAYKRGGFKALFQEFGTKHHAAQPFIGPAFRSKLKGILDRIDAAVTAGLRKARNS